MLIFFFWQKCKCCQLTHFFCELERNEFDCYSSSFRLSSCVAGTKPAQHKETSRTMQRSVPPSTSHPDSDAFRAQLERFCNSNESVLRFSEDLTKQQRAAIHDAATLLDLGMRARVWVSARTFWAWVSWRACVCACARARACAMQACVYVRVSVHHLVLYLDHYSEGKGPHRRLVVKKTQLKQVDRTGENRQREEEERRGRKERRREEVRRMYATTNYNSIHV